MAAAHSLYFCRCQHRAMNNKSIKKNIAQKRNDSGLTQAAMADKVGMSRNAYRNLEQGDTRIINNKVDIIAEQLGTTTEGLLLGYEPVEADSMRLKDIQDENAARLKQLEAEYESKLAALNEQIELLKGQVAAQQDAIKTRDEIISMLKRQLHDARQETLQNGPESPQDGQEE